MSNAIIHAYLEPVVVMVAIPHACIGVIWGHLIMGISPTMPSMIGAISLAGIVVNDSILLVEFTKMRVQEGLALYSILADFGLLQEVGGRQAQS